MKGFFIIRSNNSNKNIRIIFQWSKVLLLGPMRGWDSQFMCALCMHIVLLLVLAFIWLVEDYPLFGMRYFFSHSLFSYILIFLYCGRINLEGHRPRVRRYAHGLRKLIRIGQGDITSNVFVIKWGCTLISLFLLVQLWLSFIVINLLWFEKYFYDNKLFYDYFHKYQTLDCP